MFYSMTMTVPPNTTYLNAIEESIALMHGVIVRVIFRSRPGNASLLHVKVFHNRHQYFPGSGDDDLHSDGEPLQWEEHLEITQKPFYLEIQAWNDDDTYPHTFDIAFAVLPKYAVLPFAFMSIVSNLVAAISPKRIFTRSS